MKHGMILHLILIAWSSIEYHIKLLAFPSCVKSLLLSLGFVDIKILIMKHNSYLES